MSNRLSTRARHILWYAIDGRPEPGTVMPNWVSWMTAREARTALHKVASEQGRSIGLILFRTKGAGKVTCGALMRWMGLRMTPHACVCRHCGRHMGGAP